MTALLARGLTAWDLDLDRPDDWRGLAACAGQWDAFTEQLMPTTGVIPPKTAQAAHRCIHHCPVLAECTEATEHPGKRPQEMVQAGLWWPGYTHRPPRTLPDPGHGPWCGTRTQVRCKHCGRAHREPGRTAECLAGKVTRRGR